MNFARILQMGLLLVLVTGCSRVQFAYNQLDWLIPEYLEPYADFSPDQQAMVDDKVDALLIWHCSTQLAPYSVVLRAANADFQAGTMTKERLGEYTRRLEQFWKAIMRRASPALADLLLTASDEQVNELFVAFAEANEEWLEKFEDQTDRERRERYRERMTDELERWFGPLLPVQQRAVLDWSRRLTPLGLVGLQSRRQWQENLRGVIDNREDETVFYAGIEGLLVTPRALRSSAIQKRFDENRVISLDLIETVGAHMDDAQRTHLANQTASVAADLDELVCAPEPLGAREKPNERRGSLLGPDVRSDP